MATRKNPAKPVNATDEAEARFWAVIEAAWAPLGAKVNAARAKLAAREPDDDDEPDTLEGPLEKALTALRAAYTAMPEEELAAMDRVLEQKLYAIDRSEIQEVTDGSDDGFLYARGYIVAMGRAFYEAVDKNPAVAVMDAECEEMCYLPAHVYEQRFGAFPKHEAGISRETGSNKKGWK